MALIALLYATTAQAVLPEGNANPDRRMFMNEVTEELVWWDDVNGTILFSIGTGVGTFLPLAGGAMDDGALITSPDGTTIIMTWSQLGKDWNIGVEDPSILGNKSIVEANTVFTSIYYIVAAAIPNVPAFLTVPDANIGLLNPNTVGFAASESRVRAFSIPTYAGDAAAGVAGLVTNDLYFNSANSNALTGKL